MCNKCSYAELRLFPFSQRCWQKGFLLITWVTLSSQIPEWSLCQRKEKSGKSQHDWRLSFQISCPLYTPFRIYLRPHQKMLLNLFYQSWQTQTMLYNNLCQSLGCECARLLQLLLFSHGISLLAQCFEILRCTHLLQLQASGPLYIYIMGTKQ